jgi:hypothetical protein
MTVASVLVTTEADQPLASLWPFCLPSDLLSTRLRHSRMLSELVRKFSSVSFWFESVPLCLGNENGQLGL